MPPRLLMLDTGSVLTRVAPTAGGEPVATSYTTEAAIRCRFVQGAAKEIADGGQLVIAKALIRVPTGTAVEEDDRFKLTKFRLSTLSPARFYRIVSKPKEDIVDTSFYVEQIPGGESSAL